MLNGYGSKAKGETSGRWKKEGGPFKKNWLLGHSSFSLTIIRRSLESRGYRRHQNGSFHSSNCKYLPCRSRKFAGLLQRKRGAGLGHEPRLIGGLKTLPGHLQARYTSVPCRTSAGDTAAAPSSKIGSIIRFLSVAWWLSSVFEACSTIKAV